MKIDLNESITNNFIWSECLYLATWDIHSFPKDHKVYSNIIKTCEKMQLIRDYLKKPIIITSFYRPKEYNKIIKGALKSKHMEGLACDFIVKGMKLDDVRAKLLIKLEEFDIRMENNPNGDWIHIDLATTEKMANYKRYFKP